MSKPPESHTAADLYVFTTYQHSSLWDARSALIECFLAGASWQRQADAKHCDATAEHWMKEGSIGEWSLAAAIAESIRTGRTHKHMQTPDEGCREHGQSYKLGCRFCAGAELRAKVRAKQEPTHYCAPGKSGRCLICGEVASNQEGT